MGMSGVGIQTSEEAWVGEPKPLFLWPQLELGRHNRYLFYISGYQASVVMPFGYCFQSLLPRINTAAYKSHSMITKILVLRNE
jgi:hypothetical protein